MTSSNYSREGFHWMMWRANHSMIVLFMSLCATQFAPPLCAGEFEDQYAVAAGHYAQQRWEEALKAFEKLALSSDDVHPPANNSQLAQTVPFFQAEALHQLRRFAEARQRYEQYLQQNNHVRYRDLAAFRIAECLVLAGEHKRALAALQVFEAARPEDPRRGHIHLYKGQCHLELRDPEAAQQDYLRALEFLMQNDDYPELTAKCRFGMGKALQQLGDRKQANRFFRFLTTSDSEMADDALCQIIRNQWAEGLASESEFQRVQAEIEQFRERFATSLCREDVELVAARLLRQQGDHLEAAELLTDIVDETTASAVGGEMLFEAGRAYHAAQRSDQARHCFEQILLRWPQHLVADDAAYCLVLLADQDQLVAECKQFRRRYVTSEYWRDVTELLAETLIHQQQFAMAVECLQEWLERGFDGSDRVHYLMMLACLGAKEYESGVAAANRIQWDELAPSLRIGMLLTQGSLLAKTKQLTQADAALAHCLRLCSAAAPEANSQLSQCAAQRAVVLAEQRQIEAAMEMALLSLEACGDEAKPTPSQAETLRYVAAKARQERAFTEASLMLEVLQDRDAATSEDRQTLVAVLWSTNRRSLALKQLQTLWRDEADAAGTHRSTLRAGRILEREGKRESALEAYRWLAERAGGAGRAGRFHVGRMLEQQQQDVDAIALLKPLLAELPADGTKAAGIDARRDPVLYHLGWALADAGRAEEARETFDELSRSGNDKALKLDAVFRAAKLDAAAGRLAAAEARLDEAFVDQGDVLPPEFPSRSLIWQLQMLRGHVAASQGKWGDVVQRVSHLAESDEPPSHVRDDAMFLMAEAYYRQRQLEQAEHWFQRSAKLAAHSKPAPTWAVLAQLRQAQILAAKRQWRAAAEAAERLLSEQPQFSRRSEVAYLLGRSHAARARFTDARRAYRQVLEMPESKGTVTAAKAQWMIGETYYHQHKIQEAMDAYHRVELLHSHSQWQALALLQIAKCHRELGDAVKAEKMLQDLLQRFPDTRASQEARKTLTTVANQGASRRQNR